MRRPALARLKIILPIGRCGDEEGNVDSFVKVVNNGEVGHACTLQWWGMVRDSNSR